jgi:hypothetical protein
MNHSNQITQDRTKEIIRHFADAIKRRCVTEGVAPEYAVIDFRDWRTENIQKRIQKIPTELLRYRKDNGRIASDVLHFQNDGITLDEKDDEHQKIIKDFLYNKDAKTTEVLMKSLAHNGQTDPAIITADGFLINGNRRKVALEKLFEESNKDKFRWMKVVILPDIEADGGPPTIREIEQVENRCQLQKSGKSEYYDFDKALSIREKISKGMSLEDQLRDDSMFANLGRKDFNKVVIQHEKVLIKPLEHIDDYLEKLGCPKAYNKISMGPSDKEGRWEAFLQFSKGLGSVLEDKKKMLKHNIKDNEVGKIKDSVFKIIRKREFPKSIGLKKLNQFVQEMPKIFANPHAKKELFHLNKIPLELKKKDIIDKDGNEIDERSKDRVWGNLHATDIIGTVKRGYGFYSNVVESEGPLTLLDAALKKLEHPDMKPDGVSELEKARKLAVKVKVKAHELEKEFYEHLKAYKKLPKKKN